ncbi:MAG: autotransporter-associated beta strand repeat-containing protein, partial [Pirellulales bacterium]|nr:autotransporter-associated beta strand repeat-containing protein [Pirellulales bacterium]
MYLGDAGAGHSGTLEILGGSLSTSHLYNGYTGKGVISHSSGTVTLSSGVLYLGYQAGAEGTYHLSGTGQLTALTEYVGYDPAADALFEQSGGTNTANFLSIGSSGRYALTGGVLQIRNGFENLGALDFGGSAAVMNAEAGSIVNFARGGSVLQTEAATLDVGANSLLIVPAGFDPAVEFAAYSNAGLLHTTGTTLTVAEGQTVSGCGTLDDPVDCLGTMTSGTGGTLNFYNRLTVSGSGSISGECVVRTDDNGSGISGGLLSVNDHYLGYAGTGVFTNSGDASARHSSTNFYLGYHDGAEGTYHLIGEGATTATMEYVGYSGTGTFNVSAGANSMKDLHVGSQADSQGYYNLSGTGRVSCSGSEYVGYAGTGTFQQTGGTNNIYRNGYLYLGYQAGSEGTYALDGGELTVYYSSGKSREYIGYSGTGHFNHSAGTNTAKGLYLGYESGSEGTYALSGTGAISMIAEYIGYDAAASGTFQQSGGTNATSYLCIGPGGQYVCSLNGGSLQIDGGLENYGVLDLGGTPLAISASNALVNFIRGGTLLNTQAASLTLDAHSLLIVPAGFDPATAFQSYSNAGILHTVGTPLAIADGQTISGWGNIDDHIDCQGTLSAHSDGFINLNQGLTVSGTGNVDLMSGDLYIEDTNSGISGGSVAVNGAYVGYAGTGEFTQSAGTLKLTGAGEHFFLGYQAGVEGTYHLSGTGVIDGEDANGGIWYIGHYGTGTFNQSGGTALLGRDLYLGYHPGSVGTYNLSGTATLDSDRGTHYIGYSGTGVFRQTGEAHLRTNDPDIYLGYNTDGNGTYYLEGGRVTPRQLYVGYSGTGVFEQTAGTCSFTTDFYLGYEAGSHGTYNLSGTGVLGAGYYERIGYFGTGTFNQSGGTHSLGGKSLTLGCKEGSSGTYNLSGTGELNLSGGIGVGADGVGVFNQTGGTVNAPSGSLYLGSNAGSQGSYYLSGTGQMTASDEYIGLDPDATALFQQSGGLNVASGLWIGPSGQYLLSGGTLEVNGGLGNQGVFDGQGGSATLTIGSNTVANLARPGGVLSNASSLSVSLGGNSLLIVPAGFDPDVDFAQFDNNNGYVHHAGSTLVVADGQTITGWGEIDDPVHCQGTLNTENGGNLNLNQGLVISGSGNVDLGAGALTMEDGNSQINGGSVTAYDFYVGKMATASASQSAGTLEAVDSIYLGYQPGASGTYYLNGGLLYAQSISSQMGLYVGYEGTGVVHQTGGTCKASSMSNQSGRGLFLGYAAGSEGTYHLSSSGEVNFYNEYIGYEGTGTFYHSGGDNAVLTHYEIDGFFLGYLDQSQGAYFLSGTGHLSAYSEYIGRNGTGTFSQSGGTNTLLGSDKDGGLFLGSRSSGQGVYNLSGTGRLTAAYEKIGYLGAGEFDQSGGTNLISTNLSLGIKSGSQGSYLLSGSAELSAPVEIIGDLGTGIFTQSGGVHTVTTSLTLANGSSSSGTYQLNGGTLVVQAIGQGVGTAVFDFGGGTLKARTTLSTSLPMTLTGIDGDAQVDTAGYAVTLSGQLSGSGGLNKLGANTLTLSASNTYNGPTTVSAGTLVLASTGSLVLAVNEADNNLISVAPEATLDLYGTINLALGEVTSSSGSWPLISNGGTTIFESSFVLAEVDGDSFVQANDVWSYTTGAQQWTFSEATGVLSLITVPEPSTFILLSISAIGLLGYVCPFGKLHLQSCRLICQDWAIATCIQEKS